MSFRCLELSRTALGVSLVVVWERSEGCRRSTGAGAPNHLRHHDDAATGSSRKAKAIIRVRIPAVRACCIMSSERSGVLCAFAASQHDRRALSEDRSRTKAGSCTCGLHKYCSASSLAPVATRGLGGGGASRRHGGVLMRT